MIGVCPTMRPRDGQQEVARSKSAMIVERKKLNSPNQFVMGKRHIVQNAVENIGIQRRNDSLSCAIVVSHIG